MSAFRVEYIQNGPDARDGTFDKPWHVWAPDGSLVGRYPTESRAERERYARTIRAAGIARRAATTTTNRT